MTTTDAHVDPVRVAREAAYHLAESDNGICRVPRQFMADVQALLNTRAMQAATAGGAPPIRVDHVESGISEFLIGDPPTLTKEIYPGFALLLHVDSREVVGFQWPTALELATPQEGADDFIQPHSAQKVKVRLRSAPAGVALVEAYDLDHDASNERAIVADPEGLEEPTPAPEPGSFDGLVERLRGFQSARAAFAAAVNRYNERLASEKKISEFPLRMGNLYEEMERAKSEWLKAAQALADDSKADEAASALTTLQQQLAALRETHRLDRQMIDANRRRAERAEQESAAKDARIAELIQHTDWQKDQLKFLGTERRLEKDRAIAAEAERDTLREAATQAEACMSIVEPRSDKAEYLRILGVLRVALASKSAGGGK